MKPPITKRDRVTPLRGFAFLPGFLLDSAHILRERFKRDGGAFMYEMCEGGHMGEKCTAGAPQDSPRVTLT
jgi:hypothetical protein